MWVERATNLLAPERWSLSCHGDVGDVFFDAFDHLLPRSVSIIPGAGFPHISVSICRGSSCSLCSGWTPGLQSSCPVIMEDSIDSMSDNGCDNDTPLKQVVELCSLLAGKGLQFSISVRIKNSFVFSLKSEKSGPSQGTRRSPSMLVGRKEGSLWGRRRIPFRKNLWNREKPTTIIL